MAVPVHAVPVHAVPVHAVHRFMRFVWFTRLMAVPVHAVPVHAVHPRFSDFEVINLVLSVNNQIFKVWLYSRLYIYKKIEVVCEIYGTSYGPVHTVCPPAAPCERGCRGQPRLNGAAGGSPV